MACPTSETLHAFLDKALPPAQVQSVGEHLAGCEACTAETERVARVASVMSLSRPAPGCLGNAKLAVFAAGQLDKDAAANFVAHLGRCRKCSDALLVIRRSVTAKAPAPQAAAPAARTAPRPTVRSSQSRSSWGWAAAALVLAALGAGVWFAKHSASQGTQVAQPPAPKPPVVAPPEQAPQPPEVVHIGPPKEAEKPEEPEPPKEPDELVVTPKPPEPSPLEPDPPNDAQPPEPPQTPPEEQATRPPEPEPEPPSADDAQPPVPTAPKEQPFDLAAAVGNVDVQLPGKATWQTLREGQTLKAGGRVTLRVGGSKSARVAFPGHTLSIEKNSEIAVALFERDCELALARGSVLVDARGDVAPAPEPTPAEGDDAEPAEGQEPKPPVARKAEARGLSLDVAGARVHARGARFLAMLANRQGRVVAYDGDVHVEASGQNVAVPRGLACLLVEGKGPGEPAKADPALLLWTRELEVFVNCEAEKGRIKDPMKARTDSRASGGRFVTSTIRERDAEAGYVEFPFDAKRAGVYRLFARTSSGELREQGAFRVSIDGGKPREMRVRGRGDEWGWGGLDPVELPAGRHVVRFVDARGGLRLDTIIITTDTLFHPDPDAQDKAPEAPEGEERPPRDRPPRDGQGPGGGGR